LRILLCGQRSFTAQGLPQLLQSAGHEVLYFSRGPTERSGAAISGPVDEMHANPHLLETPFDVVVNFILLMGESVDRNIQYIRSLLEFCRATAVPHLVHISSMSAYKSSLRVLNEQAEVEPDPARKGAYGALKAATDEYIRANHPPGLKVSMVRPAFVLAPGLKSPISGNAIRLPWGRLLAIGNPHSQFPVITRDRLNEALLRVVERPPDQYESLVIAAENSPTRKAYLEACCTDLGCGKGVTSLPGLFWLAAVLAGAAAERMLGLPVPRLANRVPRQRVESHRTERRLGLNLRFDWRSALRQAVGSQEPNYELPYLPQPELARHEERAGRAVTFLGFGRIVHTRHLPALRLLGFSGEIRAHDVRQFVSPTGIPVKSLAGARLEDADLYIVASPGPAHVDAIPSLLPTEGLVLVEKPLAYSAAEFEAWRRFASGRSAPVIVCHNYRFKRNVSHMLALMRRFNPGQLQHVHIHFESPPVSNDPAVWMHDERVSRTLLMDYSINLLDVACMFGRGEWAVDEPRYSLNALGQTNLIEGRMTADNYSVSFLLRQGFSPRRARILFDFQNYSVNLGFFPDTCVAHMSNDNPVMYLKEAQGSATSTLQKVLGKITAHESDRSHAVVISSALGATGVPSILSCVAVENLGTFYRGMFRLSEFVYIGNKLSPVTEAAG